MAVVVLQPAGFINFRPTILCVDACPPVFSISNPWKYGGEDYPGANNHPASNESFYNLAPTQRAYKYCLPTLDEYPGLSRTLCAVPNCTSVPGQCGFNPGCTSVETDPSANNVTWVVDTTNPLHTSCCQFEVKEQNTQSFLPPGATADTMSRQQMFASYVQSAFGVYRALSENFTQVTDNNTPDLAPPGHQPWPHWDISPGPTAYGATSPI